MKKTKVLFEGGTTRISNKGCNYMIANAVNADGDEVELYAEYEAPEDLTEDDVYDAVRFYLLHEFDRVSYPVLKDEIIRQAEENGVDVDSLEFFQL